MTQISVKNVWSLSLDGRHLVIDRPGKARDDIQIITQTSDVATRYPSSLRITTVPVAKAMHIRTFMTVAPPADIASGPFSFAFFPHDNGGGFNLLVNREIFYFSQPQADFAPFENPIILLVPADRAPTISDREYVQIMIEFSAIKRVVISGEYRDEWRPLFPSMISVEITSLHEQPTLPFGE